MNDIESLTLSDVRAIYIGRYHNWAKLAGDDVPIQVWGYGLDTQVNAVLLGDGQISSLAKQAQSPSAMQDAITEDKYAIGFLPREEALVDDRIRIVNLEQQFLFPLLAILPEDNDKIKPVVQCLQETVQ